MSELTDHARASVSSVADGEWEVATVYAYGVPHSYRVTNCERFRELRNDIGTGTDKSLAEFIAGSRELILALAARVDELEDYGDHEDGDYTEEDLPPGGEEAFPAVVLYPRR